MSRQKWGESFLKSGLPLEHLTLLALRSIGWTCELHYEYERRNRNGEVKWFEHDVIGYSPDSYSGAMNLLIECKYHDERFFWFFLPCETEEHLTQYGALSSGEDLYIDSAVLHSAPYQMLARPDTRFLLELAPKCVWGVTISQDGTRHPNAVEEATKQLAFGFVPFCLDRYYGFHYGFAISILPVIVTSARLFRIRPCVRSLDALRTANAPEAVADEVKWLWYYHAANRELIDHNLIEINAYKRGNRYARRKAVAEQLVDLSFFPHWILVAKIEHLASAVDCVGQGFSAAAKDFSGDKLIAQIWEDRSLRRT